MWVSYILHVPSPPAFPSYLPSWVRLSLAIVSIGAPPALTPPVGRSPANPPEPPVASVRLSRGTLPLRVAELPSAFPREFSLFFFPFFPFLFFQPLAPPGSGFYGRCPFPFREASPARLCGLVHSSALSLHGTQGLKVPYRSGLNSLSTPILGTTM